jgi:hypothetical protein
MKRIVFNVLSFSLCIFSCQLVQAKVWRINNNASVAADFKELSVAIASSTVSAGDTIYLEGTAVTYANTTLNKRLVIIGSGYLLSGVGANPGLQALPFSTKLVNIIIDSLGTGSTIIGLSTTFYLNSNVDNITITRSEGYIGANQFFANSKITNLVINKCLSTIALSASVLENCKITNSIFTGSVDISKAINAFVRNNVFVTSATLTSSYVANNIFINSLTATSCVMKYNIATTPNLLPAGNNNQNGIPLASIIINVGSNDGKYQLIQGSPAIGAGEPVNGVTPDAGAFATADPYRLSGIPPIPTIYSLTVPLSVPASATSMNITFSTRSNN